MQRTREIEEANRNLLQSEKLAAVGQLAAGIAHEINTPAQYVGDNIKAIGDFFNGITRLLDFYRVIVNNYAQPDHLNQMTRHGEQGRSGVYTRGCADGYPAIPGRHGANCSDCSGHERFFPYGGETRSPISTSTWHWKIPCWSRTIVIKRMPTSMTEFGEIPAIECFPGELNQVFLNIIINAVHAIEDAGKGRGKITVITKPTETGVEVRIGDTGTGIPAEVRDHIYDPFFTTKDVGKGSGQGLNIAYRIIKQQHGGSIGFETEVGVGTTFIINLPRHLPKEQKH